MDHLFFHQITFYKRALLLFKTDRDWMSEWRWYREGGDNRRPEHEKENWAERWRTEDLRRRESKVICWETERENGLFLGCTFICVFVSLGEPRWTTLARGKQHGRFGGGGGSESWLREDTRGALAPLWVSMVATVVPLLLSRHLSLIFLSIFLLSDCVLSSRPSNRPPAPIKNKTDVATECKSVAVVNVSCKQTVFPERVKFASWWHIKPQIQSASKL